LEAEEINEAEKLLIQIKGCEITFTNFTYKIKK
jgi:hypothetical protein